MSVSVHLGKKECGEVGGLGVVEVVVLFECGACVGNESVVAFSFSLFLRPSFLLFRWFGRFDCCSEDSHVVQCMCGDGRVEDVQWDTVFGMYWGLKCLG